MACKLYTNKLCPFAHRAWIAALEKGAPIDLEIVPLGPSQPEWYEKEIYYRGTLPAMKTPEGKMVYESMYIAQYLDEKYGVPFALQPGDANMRYKTRIFINDATEYLNVLYKFLFARGGEEEAKARKQSELAMEAFEKLFAANSDGPFFWGTTFTLADISIIPFLHRFQYTLRAYKNYDMFIYAPRLKKLLAAALLRPSVFNTVLSENEYIEAYKGHAGQIKRNTTYTLYISESSPYADVARIAVNLKGIEVQIQKVDLDNLPPSYNKVNPKLQVPALVAGGLNLRESSLIVEYLDEKFPNSGVKLLPSDPQQMADGRFFLDELKEFVSTFERFFEAKEEEAKKEALSSILRGWGVLERLYNSSSAEGPFFYGAQPSFVDVGFLPMLARGQAYYTQIPDAKPFDAVYPRLQKVLSAAQANEGFAPVLRTVESYLKPVGI